VCLDAGQSTEKLLSKRITSPKSKNLEASLQVALRSPFLMREPSLKGRNATLCNFVRAPTEDSAGARSLCAKTQAIACSGKLEDLEAQARAAADEFPDDAFLRSNQGTVFLKMNKPEQALTAQERAVRLNSNDPSLRYFLPWSLMQSGKPEQAADQLEYGRSLDPEGWRTVTQRLESILLSPCRPIPNRLQ